MGALNEFFRKQNGVIRSDDPLMSVAMYGFDKDLVEGIGNSSIGANSTFDKIRQRDDVKFLFLGAKIGDCFTYMHYLEWLYKVNYRYDKVFAGNVLKNGEKTFKEQELFVRYKEVIPNRGSYYYEQLMYDNNDAKIINFGDSSISIVDEKIASQAYKKCLEVNPYFFVDIIGEKLIMDRTFIITKEMVSL